MRGKSRYAGPLVAALLVFPATTDISTAQSESPDVKGSDLFRTTESSPQVPGTARLKVEPRPKNERSKGPTEITAQGSSQFDNVEDLAVFIDEVVVVNPDFTLHCDRLTVYLKSKKQASRKDGEAAPDTAGTGGIDHAIAEAAPGQQVIILKDKLETDGSITKCVARGERAVYHANTGDLVLTGNPSLQQGHSFTIAAEPGVVMTINRNGDMVNKGATRTLLRDVAATEKQK